MDKNEAIKKYEEIFNTDLNGYLLSKNKIDEMFPDAPDIEEKWADIGQSYLPDGTKEYNNYPTVSLGWMMFIGMAVAKYWDEDWELYSKVGDLYKYLRDRIDFDHLDDYICEKVLLLNEKSHKELNELVGECAARTFNKLSHLNIEAGTNDYFYAYVGALHQLYLMGAAVELKDLGYHMTKI